MTDRKKRLTKEQYLKTHLLDMDPAKKRWYMNAMEKWTSADYERYTFTMLEMLGEPTEEQMKEARELIRRRRS